ncbi:MAG: 1-acyl-sn-glycerol-3-phosphate acyltransferase [Flavisolibacter sp.]
MFYRLLKVYARFAIWIYCRRIIINKPELLKAKGPLLLAANHPNSFLDGVILTTLFDERVYSLARGDVFKKKWIDNLLRSLQLLPIYRTSEGSENLEQNYTTFAACRKTFEQGGIVLIFSEGRCENEWHLRPLKKGTARLAITSWQQSIPLKVIPTAFNYSSFKKFGKEMHLFFGEEIGSNSVLQEETEGKRLLAFNENLEHQLKQLVYEIHPEDRMRVKKIFPIKRTASFYFLLVPAICGWLLHAPLFYLAKTIASRFKNSGHYDSVLHGLLILSYPVYLLLIFIISWFIHPAYSFLSVFILPFTAWSAVQVGL